MVGFDRNQPFRRALGNLGLDIPLRRLDPCVAYHLGGKTAIRQASVERWIEVCEPLFSGKGARDFWESVWNIAVSAWDYIDVAGSEPWEAPNRGFPYLNPSFWRGARRNRLLFESAGRYIDSVDVNDRKGFRAFLDSILQFQFGAGAAEVPLGMAALAWNAPSESYVLGGEPSAIRDLILQQAGLKTIAKVEAAPGAARTEPSPKPARQSSSVGWRIPFAPGALLHDSPAPMHQIFFEESAAGLLGQTVVMVLDSNGPGWLFARTLSFKPGETVGPLMNEISQHLADRLGRDWGEIDLAGGERIDFPGAGWPWLGGVRAFLAHMSIGPGQDACANSVCMRGDPSG